MIYVSLLSPFQPPLFIWRSICWILFHASGMELFGLEAQLEASRSLRPAIHLGKLDMQQFVTWNLKATFSATYLCQMEGFSSVLFSFWSGVYRWHSLWKRGAHVFKASTMFKFAPRPRLLDHLELKLTGMHAMALSRWDALPDWTCRPLLNWEISSWRLPAAFFVQTNLATI